MQGKTTLFCCQWKSKLEFQIEGLFIYLFLTKEQKFETFFFFIIKLNILRVVLLTQHLHKNFTTKYKWQVVKGR